MRFSLHGELLSQAHAAVCVYAKKESSLAFSGEWSKDSIIPGDVPGTGHRQALTARRPLQRYLGMHGLSALDPER
jgi:hypothetical protein